MASFYYPILIFLSCFLMRFIFVVSFRHLGSDPYYFLLCVEEYKKKYRVPIILPKYYLAEQEEQWYPPGFVVFLSLFPSSFLLKYWWVVSPVMDSIIGVLIYYISRLSLPIDANNALLAGFMYVFSINSILETEALTSRQFGSLLFTLTLWSLLEFVSYKNYIFLVLFGCAGTLLHFTHKLATQALYFSTLLISFFTKNPYYICATLSLFFFSIVFSRGFYLKILKAHIDIISFWRRNQHLLGAHQMWHSPVYGDVSLYTPKKFSKRFLGILGPIISIFIYFGLTIHYNKFLEQAFWVVFSLIIISFATTFVPWFRPVGEGFKYLKYVDVWGAILFSGLPISLFWKSVMLAYYVISSVVFLCYYKKKVKEGPIGKIGFVDEGFLRIVNLMKKSQYKGSVLVVPCHQADMLVYLTRWPVFWGTHNYPFWKVEQTIFPVFRQRLKDIVEKHKIDFLILNKEYVGEKTFQEVLTEGFVLVKEFDAWSILSLPSTQKLGSQIFSSKRGEVPENKGEKS